MSYSFSIQCNRCDTMIELNKKTKTLSGIENMIKVLPVSGLSSRTLVLTCDCGNQIQITEEAHANTVSE